MGTRRVEIRAVILSRAWIVAVRPSIQLAPAPPDKPNKATANSRMRRSGRIIAPRKNGLAKKIGQADRIARVIDDVARLKHVLVGAWHQFKIVAAKQRCGGDSRTAVGRNLDTLVERHDDSRGIGDRVEFLARDTTDLDAGQTDIVANRQPTGATKLGLDFIAVDGYEIEAEFGGTGGLSIGDDVRLSGIKVGRITRQELDPITYAARIVMSLDKRIHGYACRAT